jgi:hypothetical protein
VLQDGVPAASARHVLHTLQLVRTGAGADTLRVQVGDANPVWIAIASLGAKTAGALAAQAEAVFELHADLAPTAPARTLSVALSDPRGGPPLVRAVESGSRTPIAVAAAAGGGLESGPVRVVESALEAYNAPNPFHVGREVTAIHYRLEAAALVQVRIYTLQGGLVWEASRHEAATGPELGSLIWDGRNGAGQSVRNGVYVCRVSAGTRTTTFKIAVVR